MTDASMSDPSVFSLILAGQIPGHFVWRDEHVAAIMTIGPIKPGHCLVLPILQIDHWLDVPADLWSRINLVAQEIGRAQMEVLQPTRVALIVAGLEVPHCHLHVIPIDRESDLSFANAASSVDHAELADIARRLRERLVAHGHAEAAGLD